MGSPGRWGSGLFLQCGWGARGGGDPAPSRSCVPARLRWVWEDPGGSRRDPHPRGRRAGPGGPQAPPGPGSGMPSKAESPEAGESCCAEGPRCCWGWVGSFGGGMQEGSWRGRGMGSPARGFGNFPWLRVFPTALVGGKLLPASGCSSQRWRDGPVGPAWAPRLQSRGDSAGGQRPPGTHGISSEGSPTAPSRAWGQVH